MRSAIRKMGLLLPGMKSVCVEGESTTVDYILLVIWW